MGWTNIGLKGTLGVGCIGVFGVWADWLDAPPDDILTEFLPLFALTFAPFVILLFVRRGEVSDHTARTAHLIGVIWYGVLVAATLGLMAYRGFHPSDLFLGAFMALGVWPCVDTLRGDGV